MRGKKPEGLDLYPYGITMCPIVETQGGATGSGIALRPFCHPPPPHSLTYMRLPIPILPLGHCILSGSPAFESSVACSASRGVVKLEECLSRPGGRARGRVFS